MIQQFFEMSDDSTIFTKLNSVSIQNTNTICTRNLITQNFHLSFELHMHESQDLAQIVA
jgi:hypothetical protein